MRTRHGLPRILRLSVGAGVLALVLAAFPVAAQADDLLPAAPPVAPEAPAELPAATEAPVVEEPATESPVVDAPATEAPVVEEPATEAPAAESPVTEAPVTESPVSEAPTGEAPPEEPSPSLVPVVTSPVLHTGTVGVAYEYQLTSNVTPVTFSISGLPGGLRADSATGLISGTPTVDGEFVVRLEAIGAMPSDDGTLVRYDTLTIDPAPAPVITSPAPPAGTVGVPYRFQVTSNVSPVTFSITGLPSGLTADAASGVISGTPAVDGESIVRLEAIGTLPTGGVRHVVHVTLVIDPAPAPVITSAPLPNGVVGATYRFQVTSDVATATFSITGLPVGLSADSQSGIISGTPTVDGEYTVRVEAIRTLPTGGTSLVIHYKVIIAPGTGGLPVIISGAMPDGKVGSAYAFRLRASVPATFAALGLPAGLDLDAKTGLISGTPTTAGPVTVVVTAIAGGLSSSPLSSTITIHPRVGPSATPPVFTSTPPTTATVGTPFSFAPVVTSDTPVTFTLTQDVPGLSFDPATGLLSGVPTKAGRYDLAIIAINGASESATLVFTLTVGSTSTSTPPSETPSAPAPTSAPSEQLVGGGSGGHLAPQPGLYPAGQYSGLAETGSNASGLVMGGLAGLALLAVGAPIIIWRRRTS